MSKYFIIGLLFLGVIGIGCSGSAGSTNEGSFSSTDSARIQFEDITHDFGTITEGQVVSTTYKFKNIGTRPLEILAVNVSCGCTVAEKPEKPVGVGQSSEIKVNFNSEGKPGINKKFITVVSNAANSSEVLSFSVVVSKKEEEIKTK